MYNRSKSFLFSPVEGSRWSRNEKSHKSYIDGVTCPAPLGNAGVLFQIQFQELNGVLCSTLLLSPRVHGIIFSTTESLLLQTHHPSSPPPKYPPNSSSPPPSSDSAPLDQAYQASSTPSNSVPRSVLASPDLAESRSSCRYGSGRGTPRDLPDHGSLYAQGSFVAGICAKSAVCRMVKGWVEGREELARRAEGLGETSWRGSEIGTFRREMIQGRLLGCREIVIVLFALRYKQMSVCGHALVGLFVLRRPRLLQVPDGSGSGCASGNLVRLSLHGISPDSQSDVRGCRI